MIKRVINRNAETTIPNTITDFLNNQYKEFSIFTVSERAIPSVIDGLKPGARKILNAMFTGSLKDGKTYKLLSLVGDTMKLSLYAHGDISLIGTICTISKEFYNFYNPLEIEGQGGILRSPEAGSPRYLYIRKSKWADLIYGKDYDLLDFKIEEGQQVEPYKYLPIIPNILSNLSMGIANGYSFHTMSYNPIDIIDVCKAILENKPKNFREIQIKPFLRNIKDDNWKFENGNWYSYGEWKFIKSKDVLEIKDLPYDMTYNAFEKLLNTLCEKEYIKEYIDMSENGNINYQIIFPKNKLSAELAKGETALINKFKLIKQVPNDLLWVLDENGKLVNFEDKYKLIEYFVNYRLTIYSKRKKILVKLLEDKIKKNDNLVKFIELICKGKLKIRNRSKKDIKADMDTYNLPMELINTPMSKCTVEERDELLKQNENLKKELDYVQNTTEKQMYINDLNELKKEIKKDIESLKNIETNKLF